MLKLAFAIVIAIIAYSVYLNFVPRMIGVHNGRLSPCPWTPNCVSSEVKEGPAHIEPLKYKGDRHTIDKIAAVIRTFPRTTIITQTDNYLHAEFRSKLFRFVDDVEFLYLPDQGIVQVRSASRVGYSDLGVNRKRIEEIRNRINS
ncbi:MAG: DUF1499 domain-containing protein [Chlamydiales bacterium]|nr:DUF1499 domain-containing protein [Chlamydiia bacterium]MCP5506845.1 DUF1499 domain-containing protein [Chlamydiales bacterium]